MKSKSGIASGSVGSKAGVWSRSRRGEASYAGSSGGDQPGQGGQELDRRENEQRAPVRGVARRLVVDMPDLPGSRGRGSSPDDAGRWGRARWRWARAAGKRQRRRTPSLRNRGGGSWTGVTARRRLRPCGGNGESQEECRGWRRDDPRCGRRGLRPARAYGATVGGPGGSALDEMGRLWAVPTRMAGWRA